MQSEKKEEMTHEKSQLMENIVPIESGSWRLGKLKLGPVLNFYQIKIMHIVMVWMRNEPPRVHVFDHLIPS